MQDSYTSIWIEMFNLYKSAQGMEDLDLVRVVADIADETDDDIMDILQDYDPEKRLSELNKGKLIAFYVLNFGINQLEE